MKLSSCLNIGFEKSLKTVATWLSAGEARKIPVSTTVAVLGVLVLVSLAFADGLTGQASVVDGDTIEIHGTRIRVFGIDAPETDHLCRNESSEHYRCGQKTSNALFDFINRRTVDCIEVDRDRHKRAVAVCTVDGIDLAEWLVKNGLALDWPVYSKRAYEAAQSDAKREHLGMWAGSFREPWKYRSCRRQSGAPTNCSD
jgi:endonuclease YncB( thermonuclease family)